ASDSIHDFMRQPLLVNPLSFSGPGLAKADVNGDGLDDIYTGGGKGQAGALYLQQKSGSFIKKDEPAFEADKMSEDVDAVFFDANGDGFIDLYVVSGGYDSYQPEDALLQDRLYLNDGKGGFKKDNEALPIMHVSKSCAKVADINGDGHPDIFVGGRVVPGQYPVTPASFVLVNDGKGHFKDEAATIAPQLQKAGMITDAAWIDLNGDNREDLVVVGEWMPVMAFVNDNGKLVDKTTDFFDNRYSGWWNKLLAEDVNGDGRKDLVIGNLGENSQCRVSDAQPADLYYKDFDNDGNIDPILCFYVQGKSYPFATKDELVNQLPALRKKFADYKSYADATIGDVLESDQLKDAGHLTANYLETAVFLRDATGKFRKSALPLQAQFAPVFAITAIDYDKDGHKDLLLCGNINHASLRFGKYDANYGVLLHNDGKGNFSYVSQLHSGFSLKGDVRSIININNTLLFGINGQAVKAYKLQ
ncbi:MAG TPA: VCBS repeat-containing protein, partial [Chitinophagaceae bacterium]|nr:VCBS repeat-containing protein [Chitinophagaceae bacterium]